MHIKTSLLLHSWKKFSGGGGGGAGSGGGGGGDSCRKQKQGQGGLGVAPGPGHQRDYGQRSAILRQQVGDNNIHPLIDSNKNIQV